MKLSGILVAAFWSLMLGMGSAGRADSGKVIFANSITSSVLDGRTGLPVGPGRVVAGLYANTNLDAGLGDPFELVAIAPVSSLASLWGIFLGGTVAIPGTVPNQPVLLQVRVWPVGFDSCEEALSGQADPVAQSDTLGPVKLGGDIQPIPSLSIILRTNLILRYAYANNAPRCTGATFALLENRTFSDQLTGSDYDGDALTFSLVSTPRLGTVAIEPDGRFVYQPFPGRTGTDSFTFKVNDGELDSRPATVTLTISAVFGQIIFRNSTTNLVLDSRTGQAVAPGVAVAGLYLSTNLNDVPDPSEPKDNFQLVAVTPVSPGTNLSLWGLYDGGLLDLIGLRQGQPVLLQVRVWGTQFPTYEKAFNNPEVFVAVSELLGPVALGGLDRPVPVLAELPGLLPMTLAPRAGNNPPEAHNATFVVTNANTFTGQLSGSDPEADPLTFLWVTSPDRGTFSLFPDGRFTYRAYGWWGDTIDSFTFKVSDGSLTSAVATVALYSSVRLPNGTVIFRNDPSTRILDTRTGLPVAPGVAVAGLYVRTNLNALPDPNLPNDDFALVATAPVSAQSSAALRGLFDAGTLNIPGTIPGQRILLQVRAWTAGLASHDDALQIPEAVVAASAVLGPVTLGGGFLSAPSLVNAGLTEMALVPVNPDPPPRAFDLAFLTYDDVPFSGQLTGRDHDAEPLSFLLISAPTLGTVTLEQDGQFLYQPRLGSAGSDSFTFKVSDGDLHSLPATVSIQLISHAEPGRIIFNNASRNRVMDARTGMAVAPGMALAGLYVSTNLNAQPDPSLPNDAFELAALAPVSPVTNSVFWGLFYGGSVQIPNTRPGQSVVLQLRVWDAAFPSYAEALQETEPLVAHSDLVGPIVLGGGGLPEVVLGQTTNLLHLTLRFLRGTHPPVAQDSALSGRADTVLSGRLTGSDPDGDALTFRLAFPPMLGTAVVQPDGSFTYRPLVTSNATDSFTFQAMDGNFTSAPATVSILTLHTTPFQGRISFRNSSRTLVIDGRTGEPVGYRVALAGLYFTADLSATPNLSVPRDAFELAAVTPVCPSPNALGFYSGGTVYLPSQDLLLQVRVWPTAYVSYEDALNKRADLVGGSSIIRIRPSTGTEPDFSVGVFSGGITLGQPGGKHPPAAQDWTFTGREDMPLTGQLPAIDQDGDPLSFALLSGTSLGQVTVQTNGKFTYRPGLNLSGTDSFTFMVNDGATSSPPATIQIHILPVNDPPTPVIRTTPLSSLFDPSPVPSILSPNNSNALVLLDGSLSSDTELDDLSYAWFSGPDLIPLATGQTAQVEFDVGTHTITLLVDDGQDTATAQVTFEVVTPGAAVEELTARIERAGLEANRKKSLLVSLQAALASFDRDQVQAGLNQLGAFLEKLRSQVAPQAPLLADEWTNLTREILDSISAAAERDPKMALPRGQAQSPSSHGRTRR